MLHFALDETRSTNSIYDLSRWFTRWVCVVAETLQVGFSWKPCLKTGKDCVVSQTLAEVHQWWGRS